MLKKRKKISKLILAVDADSSKIGVCMVSATTGELLHSSILSSKMQFFSRTLDLRKQFKNLIKKTQNDYQVITRCIIEDYGYYPVQRYANMKAELIGMIKVLLLANDIWNFSYFTTQTKGKKGKKKTYTFECSCAPSQLKKFIFGKGNVVGKGKGSSLMLEVYKQTGHEFKNDDQADSYMLALMFYVYSYCLENSIYNYNDYKKNPAIILNADRIATKLTLNQDKFEPIIKWLKGQGVKK